MEVSDKGIKYFYDKKEKEKVFSMCGDKRGLNVQETTQIYLDVDLRKTYCCYLFTKLDQVNDKNVVSVRVKWISRFAMKENMK